MATITRPVQREAGRSGLQAVLGRDFVIGYLFVLPLIVFIFGLIAYPTVYGIYLSMTSKIAGRPEIFVGLENYESLWQDR